MKKSIFLSFAIIVCISLVIFSCDKDDDTTTTNTYTTSDCSGKTGVDKVVCLSHNFLASLSGTQLASAEHTLTLCTLLG